MEVSASILSADFLNLEEDIKLLDNYQVDTLHIDIMDGYFVDNVTWGAAIVECIKKITEIPLDIHLLIEKPERKLKKYIELNPNFIYIHPESTKFIRKNLLDIRSSGIKAGLALKLETPIETIMHCMDILDGVLLLSCDEGFGGNPFNELVINKIKKINSLNTNNKKIEIVIDGGINEETSQIVKEAGATKIITGSYLFENRNNIDEIIEKIK